MARPQKQTVEYFSHDANASEGKTLSILFNHFGHEGLSAWWLLLERISNTRNHIISIRNPESFEYLSAKLHFQPDRLRAILNKMAELEAIDKPLLEAGYIWCQNFVDRLEPIYKTRGQSLPSKPQLLNIIGVGVSAKLPETELSGKETELSGKETEFSIPENTHTKETKETILKKLKKTPPDNQIPKWLNKENWDAFLEMRKVKKATPTARAKELLIKALDKLRLAGDDPNEVLNQSIMNSWKGVFALTNRKGSQSGTYKTNPTILPDRNSYTRPEDL